MSGKRWRDTPERAWEQALIDAYYDYRWHQVLDPLAAAVRRWEAGELDHVDLARAAGRVRKGMSPIDYLFSEKREMLVCMIEFDEEWSGPGSPPIPDPKRRRYVTLIDQNDTWARSVLCRTSAGG